MKNSYELVWTNEALKGLNNILDYLQDNFSIQVTQKFVTQLDKQLNMILQNPALFPASIDNRMDLPLLE